MFLLKIAWKIHILLKKAQYKILYGKRISLKKVVFRKSFSALLEKNAILSIGENTFFNNYCSINCLQRISIGSNCMFGENVKVYDHSHSFNNDNVVFSKQPMKKSDVKIGNNCWIGSNCVILNGTEIGDNCVICAGAIVKGIIPANSILKRKDDLTYIEQIKYK